MKFSYLIVSRTMQTPGKTQVVSRLMRIDPNNRDTTTYPKTSHYRVEFGKTFTNVVGVELLDARIPFTEPNITSDRNTLVYQVGSGTLRTATVDAGTYTASSLVTALNAQFTSHGDGMSVAYSTSTQKFTFSAGSDFTIFPTKSTMKSVVGIISSSYKVTSSSSAYTPDGIVDLIGSTKYIVVKCMDMHEPGFCSACDPGVGILHTTSPPEFRPYPTHFFSVIKSKLSGLTIKLERDSGEEYDTGGINHLLLFRVYTLDSTHIPQASPDQSTLSYY